ncbi:MAG: helix-turn-helix transcriptional regulator [Phycisphaerales bacterium]|nr:helix-turn-helix transcriptional regulator [Phycisphaerales bacterium]
MIRPATAALNIPLDAKAIGKRIASARRAKRWRQADLATACGVTKSTICSWEIGLRIPPVQRVVRLAIHLRRATDWLLCGRPKRGQLWKMARVTS